MANLARLLALLKPHWGIIKPLLFALGFFLASRAVWLYNNAPKAEVVWLWVSRIADLIALGGMVVAGVRIFRLASKPKPAKATSPPAASPIAPEEFAEEQEQILCAMFRNGNGARFETNSTGTILVIGDKRYHRDGDPAYQTRYELGLRALERKKLVEDTIPAYLIKLPAAPPKEYRFVLTDEGKRQALKVCAQNLHQVAQEAEQEKATAGVEFGKFGRELGEEKYSILYALRESPNQRAVICNQLQQGEWSVRAGAGRFSPEIGERMKFAAEGLAGLVSPLLRRFNYSSGVGYELNTDGYLYVDEPSNFRLPPRYKTRKD